MPHKTGNKWKWGNVERSSKDDLRRTVYGIWLKNGGRGSFSKFWETGRVDEDGDGGLGLVFSKVGRRELPGLLDEIETYNENERFSRENLEKYLTSGKTIDREENSMYYGLFDGDRCLALSYLNKVPDGCVLISEIQCVVHGYGRILIDDIVDKSRAMWLAANPEGGDSLLEYYRGIFNGIGSAEIVLERSKWNGGNEQHFFVKSKNPGLFDRIADHIRAAEVPAKR